MDHDDVTHTRLSSSAPVMTTTCTDIKVVSSLVIRTLDFLLLLSNFLRCYFTKLNVDSYT